MPVVASCWRAVVATVPHPIRAHINMPIGSIGWCVIDSWLMNRCSNSMCRVARVANSTNSKASTIKCARRE